MKKAIIGLVAGMLIGSAGMAAAATTQTVQAVLTKFTISVDGQKQTLKADPLVYNGTTYLPVREVAAITGYGLEFDNTKKSIDLISKGGTTVTTNQSTVSGIKGRALVELLAKKYPDLATPTDNKLSLSLDGSLVIGDQKYQLQHDDQYNYDVTPLLNAGVLSAEDLQ